MTDLKCPFCPEVRPSRSRLQTHIDGMHYMQHNKDARRKAVDNARTVEDVKVKAPELTGIKCPYCSEIRADRTELAPHVHSTHADVPAITRINAVARTVEDVKVKAPELAGLKCPFCPEVWASRSRLQQHVDGMHYEVATSKERLTAVGNARTVETVQTVEVCCECGTDNPIVYHNYQDEPFCAPCVDGHDKPAIEAGIDPDTVTDGLTRMNAKLSVAGEQMAEMKAALDAVDEKMKVLDAQLVSPPVIRHATLNEVWDRLMAAGNLTGAITVMEMIREGNVK